MSRYVRKNAIDRLIDNYSLHINTIGLTNCVSEQKPSINNIPYDSMSVCHFNKSVSWQYSGLFVDEHSLCHIFL